MVRHPFLSPRLIRPTLLNSHSVCRGKPRNDSGDAYATFPIHAGRTKPPTDAFSQGVQRTQSVLARPSSLYSNKLRLRRFCWQATDRDWNFRPGSQVQGRRHARRRLPRCVPPTPLQTIDTQLTRKPGAASYGSLARFKDIRRLYKVSESTMIGASGDMADFQQVKHMLQGLMSVHFPPTRPARRLR